MLALKKYLVPAITAILLSGFCTGCKMTHLAYTEPGLYHLDSTLQAADEIEQMVAPYKKELAAEMEAVLVHCAKDLYKELPECGLGNWLADLIYEEGQVIYGDDIDFAVYNYGGIRLPMLAQGPVTKGKLFELMPFENMLVLVDVDYPTLLQLLNRMAAYGGWPVSRSLQFEIENGVAVNTLLNGKPLDENRSYKIIMSDYIANGGDKCFFFKDRPRQDFGFLIRDLIIKHAGQLHADGKKIDANVEGRVKVIGGEE